MSLFFLWNHFESLYRHFMGSSHRRNVEIIARNSHICV